MKLTHPNTTLRSPNSGFYTYLRHLGHDIFEDRTERESGRRR